MYDLRIENQCQNEYQHRQDNTVARYYRNSRILTIRWILEGCDKPKKLR